VNAPHVRIALAEDHEVMRRGLASLLSKVPGYEVVGEASNGLDALTLADKTTPDILIVDLMMPGLPGSEVVRRVSHRHPKTGVVVLSMHSAESHELEALRNGARAFVPKDAPAAELLKAIASVVAGHRYFSQPLVDDAIEGFLGRSKKGEADPVDSYSLLTNREREVFQLVAEGLKASAIADRLYISVRTVETHRAHITAKLGLRGQNEVVRYAIGHGLVPLQGPEEVSPSPPRRK
jgi:two-component system, NarL family, response regulator NreC